MIKLFLFFTFILLLISCETKEVKTELVQEEKKEEKIDSSSIVQLAINFNNVLMADSVNLDSVQWYIDSGVLLNYPVSFDHKVSGGYGKEGGFLYNLTYCTSTTAYSLTPLQATIKGYGVNFENATLQLLQAGADPNALSIDSISCLEWVQKVRNEYVWTKPKWQKKIDQLKRITDTLIYFGAKVELMNLSFVQWEVEHLPYYIEQGANPETIKLSAFFKKGAGRDRRYSYRPWRNYLKIMLKAGADPQKVSPYDVFDNSLDPNLMDDLLKYGLDLNEPFHDPNNIYYEYWLDYAIHESGDRFIIRYLLSHGAAKTNGTYNVYDYAVSKGYPTDLLKLIEKNIGR